MEPEIPTVDAARVAFEAALREDDSAALYDSAPCGYLSLDLEGRVLKTNQTFLTWVGYERDELVQQKLFTDLLAPGSRVYFETHLRPLLHMNDRASEIALDLTRRDGVRLPAFVNAVVVHEADRPAVIRVVVFEATERRRYEQELLAAKRAAEESERRYARLAQTLQSTLMPPRHPHIDGVDVATAYRPAGAGDEIGGDFYDVFEVADGDWAVIIGDVAGKGAEAAVVATLARHTIRAVAINEASPAGILEQLNQVLLSGPGGRHLTATVLRMRRIGDWWDVSMALGGHPPSVLLSLDQVPHRVGDPGQPVGMLERARFRDVRIELHPGNTLLMHTDGVTEARDVDSGAFYGEDRLMRLLHDNVEPPHALVGRVLDDVLTFQRGSARDDIALLALQVPLDQHASDRNRATSGW